MLCPNTTPDIMVEVRKATEREPKAVPVLYWMLMQTQPNMPPSLIPVIWDESSKSLAFAVGGKIVRVES